MAHSDEWYIKEMTDTLEEYNEETRWEPRESAVIRDGHIKIATITAARIDPGGTVGTTTEILVGVFGSTDRLDHFAVWNADDKMVGGSIVGTFLHQGPVQGPVTIRR